VPPKTKDVEMKEANPKAKSAPLYHFTSDVQEMYDLDKIVREKVNKTIIQLELGELLAISALLRIYIQTHLSKCRRSTQRDRVGRRRCLCFRLGWGI